MRRLTTLILSLSLLAVCGCSGGDDGAAYCDSCSLTDSAFQSCFLNACEFCDIPGGTGYNPAECAISVGRIDEILACQDRCDGCGSGKGCRGCADDCTGSASQMRCGETLANEAVSCSDGVYGGGHSGCSDTEILPSAASCEQYAEAFDCSSFSYHAQTAICSASGCECAFVIDDIDDF